MQGRLDLSCLDLNLRRVDKGGDACVVICNSCESFRRVHMRDLTLHGDYAIWRSKSSLRRDYKSKDLRCERPFDKAHYLPKNKIRQRKADIHEECINILKSRPSGDNIPDPFVADAINTGYTTATNDSMTNAADATVLVDKTANYRGAVDTSATDLCIVDASNVVTKTAIVTPEGNEACEGDDRPTISDTVNSVLDTEVFIPLQLLDSMRNTCYGFVALIQEEVLKLSRELVLSRFNQDCCENHFSHTRASSGSTDHSCQVQCKASDDTSTIMRDLKVSARANSQSVRKELFKEDSPTKKKKQRTQCSRR